MIIRFSDYKNQAQSKETYKKTVKSKESSGLHLRERMGNNADAFLYRNDCVNWDGG
jgi:hypothetical protein